MNFCPVSRDNPPPSIQKLYEYLFEEYEYEGSYRSVLRYVRKHYPPPRVRARRRVELPAGCGTQVDWAESISVIIDGELIELNALVMTLSYSEMKRLRSPATGKSVYDSMIEEGKALRTLPLSLPEPFDVVVHHKVGIDCLVHFEGRFYACFFPYVGDYVQVKGCVGKVQIFCTYWYDSFFCGKF